MEIRDKIKLKSSSPPKKYFVMDNINNNHNYDQKPFEEKSNGIRNFNRKISIKYTEKELNTEQNNIIKLLVSKKILFYIIKLI